MAQRARKKHSRGFYNLVLKSAEVASKGEIACINSSAELVAVSAATGLMPIGYFCDDLTGDGSTKVKVELFDELWAHGFSNDSTTPVASTDIGKVCYLKSGSTVSGDSTSRSPAGIVLELRNSDATVDVLMFDMRHSEVAVAGQGASGAETAVDHADVSPVTLLAAASYSRVVILEGECTETIAGDNDPTFSIGYTGSVAAAVTTTEAAAAGTAGDHISGSCVLPAGKALIATLADGGDAANDAGAFVFRAIAAPGA